MRSDERVVVLVAGSSRSGSSALAGVLSKLGLSVPQPEIPADETNPRGFFEPAWVVEYHRELLATAKIAQQDARPDARAAASAAACRRRFRVRLRTWLDAELDRAPAVVVKDPRIAWFVGAWLETARDLDARPVVATPLRHPAEVVVSHLQSYSRSDRPAPFRHAPRTASWINLALATEEASRSVDRVLIRYADLIEDWRAVATRVQRGLRIPLPIDVADRALDVDGFIEPRLRRVRADWDSVDAPARLCDLAQSVWDALDDLASSGSAVPGMAERLDHLDRLRGEYDALYAESEAIARSSIRAVRRPG